MPRTNVFAFTPPGASPPYASLNREEDGSLTLHVRGAFVTDGRDHHQPAASIVLTDEALFDLFFSVGEHIFGDDLMKAAGKVVLTKAHQIADSED